LEAIGVAPEQVLGAIPNWIRTELPAIDSDPFMIQGPAGERAAVGRFDGLLFCAWIDLEHTLARLVFAMREEEQPQSTTLSILSLVLFPVLRDVFLRQRGLLLHSAAVKCPNGVGIQFVAESGGGKTTTSLSLVRLGAKLVSDDLVVVSPSGNKATAYGLPKPLNLREPTLKYFEELRRSAPPANPLTGKSSVIPQSVYGTACLAASCSINVLYFLNLSDSGPSLSRLGVGVALEKLLDSHAFCVMQPTGGDSIVGFCDLLSLVPAYQLDTGRNPEHLGKWLLENCHKHAQLPAVRSG
jgi:hypothetical protein